LTTTGSLLPDAAGVELTVEFEGYLRMAVIILLAVFVVSGLFTGDAEDWLDRQGLR
jgi:hypothetical protein